MHLGCLLGSGLAAGMLGVCLANCSANFSRNFLCDINLTLAFNDQVAISGDDHIGDATQEATHSGADTVTPAGPQKKEAKRLCRTPGMVLSKMHSAILQCLPSCC